MGSQADRLRPESTAVDPREVAEARATLQALALPRLTGSRGAASVERELRRRLHALGYAIHELPFTFSSWPGRYGVSFAGALLAVAIVAATGLLILDRPWPGALVLVACGLSLLSMSLAASRAIRDLPWGRMASANWLVARPGARPRFLIMAHRDSKSQGGSLYLRAASVVAAPLSAAALLLAGILAGVQPTWAWPPWLLLLVGAPGLAAGVGLALCYAANRSPGALDNASGVAALLLLARRERSAGDVAFLVTDAEELGLAGALQVGPDLPPVAGIINLDGLDDEGEFYIVDRHGFPATATATAPHLAAALMDAARELGWPARTRHLPPGILADHVALASQGWPALTLMRGTNRSLRRVHRPDDDLDHLHGTGVARSAALVSAALERLRSGTS